MTPVDAKELHILESTLGKVLPESYLQFITRHGLFSATDAHGDELARMLSPAEVLDATRGRSSSCRVVGARVQAGDMNDMLAGSQREHEPPSVADSGLG